MSISNLTGTGKIDKLSNIYNVNYKNDSQKLSINFTTTVKINTINELKEYIKFFGKETETGKIIYVNGIKFQSNSFYSVITLSVNTTTNQLSYDSYNYSSLYSDNLSGGFINSVEV